jgi:hypothetical protein
VEQTKNRHDSTPYTGWTRRTWEDLAARPLAAVRPYATPGHALIQLPGPESRSGRRSDGRSCWRLSNGAVGRGRPGRVVRGRIAAGTDPHSPQRWPTFAERAQAKVEAASIAIAPAVFGSWVAVLGEHGVRGSGSAG